MASINPSRWGASRVAAFKSCPYSAVLYVLGGSTSKEMASGTALHLLVQHALGLMPLSDAHKQALSGMVLGDEPADTIVSRVVGMVQEIVPSGWRMAAEVDVSVLVPPNTVSGQIDLLATDDNGNAIVIDLKMGEGIVTDDDVHEQTGLYRDLVLDAKETRNAWAYIVTRSRAFKPSLHPAGHYLADAARAIEASKTDAAPRPGASCVSCHQLSLCSHAHLEASDEDASEYVRIKLEARKLDMAKKPIQERLLAHLKAAPPVAGSKRSMGPVVLHHRTTTKVSAESFLRGAQSALLSPAEIAAVITVRSGALEVAKESGFEVQVEKHQIAYLKVAGEREE